MRKESSLFSVHLKIMIWKNNHFFFKKQKKRERTIDGLLNNILTKVKSMWIEFNNFQNNARDTWQNLSKITAQLFQTLELIKLI